MYIKDFILAVDSYKRNYTGNYNKILQEEFIVSTGELIKEIYETDKYFFYLRGLWYCPRLLEKEGLADFILNYDLGHKFGQNFKSQPLSEDMLYHTTSKEFSETMFGLKSKMGVYRFNWKDTPLYVGSSLDLYYRICDSIIERCLNYHNDLSFQYILCDSKSEYLETEKYYIQHLKPIKNITNNKLKEHIGYNGSMPVFSEKINMSFKPYFCAFLYDGCMFTLANLSKKDRVYQKLTTKYI